MPPRLCYSLIFVALFSPMAFADGLIYQLPDDGHWVQFEMDGKGTEPGGTAVTMTGTLTMKSVGTVKIDGQEHRWIEIVIEAKRDQGEFAAVEKLLIPEENLAEGKDPLKHVFKAWTQHSQSGNTPREVQDLDGVNSRYLQRLRPMLHAPFEEADELEAVRIESHLGELSCKGIRTSEKIEQEIGVNYHWQYLIRLHEKAPFGVVTWESETSVELNGELAGTMTTKMKLVDSGTDAKSAIPSATLRSHEAAK